MRRLFIATYIYLKIIFGNSYFSTLAIVFPIIIGIIYGATAQSVDNSFVRTAFVDNDQTEASDELYKRLKLHEGLETFKVSIDEGKKLLEGGKIEAIFILEKGFEENLSKVDVSASISIITLPASFSGAFLAEILASDISVMNSKILAEKLITQKFNESGVSTEGLQQRVYEYYDILTEKTPLMEVNYNLINSSTTQDETRKLVNPQNYMIYGGLLMFIMFFLLFGSGWIIEERENGTLRRLKTVKRGFGFSFLAAFICLVISGIVQSTIFILVGRILGTVYFSQPLVLFVLFTFIACASSISMLLASIFKTSLQLHAFTPFFVLLSSFIGSCFVDISLLSETFERLTVFTPQGVALKAMQAIFIGEHGNRWMIYSGALLVASALMLLISYKLSSKKAMET